MQKFFSELLSLFWKILKLNFKIWFWGILLTFAYIAVTTNLPDFSDSKVATQTIQTPPPIKPVLLQKDKVISLKSFGWQSTQDVAQVLLKEVYNAAHADKNLTQITVKMNYRTDYQTSTDPYGNKIPAQEYSWFTWVFVIDQVKQISTLEYNRFLAGYLPQTVNLVNAELPKLKLTSDQLVYRSTL